MKTVKGNFPVEFSSEKEELEFNRRRDKQNILNLASKGGLSEPRKPSKFKFKFEPISEKREKKREVRTKLRELIESEHIKPTYCNVGIFKFKKEIEKNKNKLLYLASYLDFDVTLYVWNFVISPKMSIEEQNKIRKLNALVEAYEKNIIPMMENEINIFFIPYIGYSICRGNLIKEILEMKVKGIEQTTIYEQSKILILKNFEIQDYLSFLYLYDTFDAQVIFFIIYWIIESCRRRGFNFNFKDYRSIKILKIPLTSFTFILSDHEVFHLYTEFIPLFDLYYCDINEEFDIDFFELYTSTAIVKFEDNPFESTEFNVKMTNEDILKEIKEETEKEENISVYKRLLKLTKKEYLIVFRRTYKYNEYGLSVLKKGYRANIYYENILFIDEKIRTQFYASSLNIKNLIPDFIIKNFYPEFEYTIEKKEKPKLLQLFSIKKYLNIHWLVVFSYDITNGEKYIFDFKDTKTILGVGGYGTVWIACRSNEVKEFNIECNYAAKFVLSTRKNIAKFASEYEIAKKASDANIGIKIIDYYLVQHVLEFKGYQRDYILGVIIMERWPETLLEYINHSTNEYKKYRNKIKEKWINLHLQLYSKLGIRIRDLHLNNTMIKFEHEEPKLILIDFGNIIKPDKVTKEELSEFYDKYEKTSKYNYYL